MGLSLQYEDLRIIQKNYHRAFYTGMHAQEVSGV